MGLKNIKILLILLVISIIGYGCASDFNTKDPSSLLDKFKEELTSKNNVVFLSNTTINRRDQMATVNLKGVQFIETNQFYFIGDASGHRLELYINDEKTYIKSNENQWIDLKSGGATEIETFLNNPLRVLEYSKYGDLKFLENTIRLNGRNHIVLSGSINNAGINKYIENYVPELLETYEEVFIEISLYIDAGNKSLTRMDLFINEYSGEFSLVSEIIITDYNVNTEIIPPK